MAPNYGNISFSCLRDVEEWARHIARVGPVLSAAGDVTGPWSALAIAAGAVGTTELATGAAAIANLADAVQDLIYTHTISKDGDKAAGVDATLTIQVKDAAGNNLAGRFLFRFRAGTADFGAPAAGFVLTGITAGTTVEITVANQDYWIETDSTGKITITGNKAAAGTLYFMASMSKTQSVSVTWT